MLYFITWIQWFDTTGIVIFQRTVQEAVYANRIIGRNMYTLL